MKETHEELGVIDGIHIGNRHVGRPVMWFGVKTLHGGSLQVLSWFEAEKLIRESGVEDFAQLDGKPCVVETDGHIVIFRRLHK
jgi:hypothetical protein